MANVIGTQGNDLIGSNSTPGVNGNTGGLSDVVYALNGNDSVEGLGGNDFLYGGQGNDSLLGQDGDDELYGGAGLEDILIGGAGNDILYGGSGRDVLNGGLGKDVMFGGVGPDVFDFDAVIEIQKDVIRDFSRKEADLISLKDVDAKQDRAGDQKFTFIGSKAFSGKSGELQFKKGKLKGDTTGDGKADFVILVDVKSLNEADIVL